MQKSFEHSLWKSKSGAGIIIFHGMVTGAASQVGIFRQRCEDCERGGLEDSVEGCPGRTHSKCKGPGVGIGISHSHTEDTE